MEISEPGDKYEQEANQVADQVLSGSIPPQQHLDMNADGVLTDDRRERQIEKPKMLRSSTGDDTSNSPSSVQNVLESPGQPLDTDMLSMMEPRFNRDFRNVHIHTDTPAAESARAAGALAYTIGNDVVFAANRFDPDTSGGQRLIAHELAHVAQHGTADEKMYRQPASANEAATKAAQVPVRIQNITASVTLPAGQILDPGPANVISTTQDTQVFVRADPTRLTVTFEPFLTIVADSDHSWVPNPTINLETLYFDYKAQMVGASWTAPNYANWWGDIGAKILGELKAAMNSALPPRMFAKDYNPFDDPNLPADLPAIALKIFSSGLGGGTSAPKIKTAGASLGAEFLLGGELQIGRVSIESGTSVEINADMAGGVPTSATDVQISSIFAKFCGKHPRANVNVAGIPAVFVSGVTFFQGGALRVDYELVTEVFEELARILLAGEVVREGGYVGEGASEARHTRIRAIVDGIVHTEVEPLLRQLILQNRNAVPGLDLARVLGIPAATPATAPTPATKP
jgi:hypothetical protein